MAIEGTGPVRSTLDHVVEKLQQMNKDQTALQEEAVLYSQELQDYISKEGHNMSTAQLQSTNELILALQEGRLEDLEEHREELLRNRAEAKRDEERNETLKDQFKQLKKQYKLLERAFSEKDGMSFIGLIIRTALVGFVFGVVQGFIKPYVAALKAIGGGIAGVAKNAFVFFKFDKLFAAIKTGFANFRIQFVEFFKNSRLVKFFQGKGAGGGMISKIINFFKLTFKDLFTLGKNLANFLMALRFAFFGLFIEAPLMFKRLAEAKIAFSPKSPIFKFLGNLINFIKKPFVAVITKIKNAFTGISFGLAAFADKIAGFFTSSGKSTIFQQAVNRIKELFAKQGPLSRFFGFFSRIQGLFVGIGQVVGKLLWPVLFLFGFIKGFMSDIKKEEDMANKLIRGFIGGIRDAFRILIGSFLDFIKQALGFLIDLIPGVDGVREKFKQFSFADFFDNLYNMFANGIINMLNKVRDTISDIGIGGLLKNVGVFLYTTFQKILAFPKAVGAGALAAIKNLFSSPVQAFNEAFQAKMANENARISAIQEGLYETADGRKADGEYIKGLSEEGDFLKQKAMFEDQAPGALSQTEMLSLAMGGDTVFIQPPEEKSGFGRLFSNLNPFD